MTATSTRERLATPTPTPTQPPQTPSRPSTAADRYRRQGRALAWRADAIEIVGWVSMAVAAALYLAYGGANRFGSVGAAFTSIGILSGLVATDAVLLMLVLAARVPFIDRTLGHPRALALHARMGQWAVIGLGLHAAFLITGYALTARTGVIDQFLAFWDVTPDFGWAVLGMVLFLIISGTSIVAARAKLPYEVWHALHLVSYVAVAASIPHMFSLGGLFADNTFQRWYWIGLLSATAAALLVYRFLMPVLTTLDHQLRVASVSWISPDTVNIELTGRRLADLGAQAGQYFHWRFLAPGLWWHQHPFSLSAAPTANSLRITVRVLGKGTAQLVGVRPGTWVAVEGPYGIFSDAARTREAVVLVGAGVGIAPIRAILEGTHVTPGRAAVVLRASDADGLYLVDEVTRLCRERGVALALLTGPRAGDGRWVPASNPGLELTHIAPYLAEADVFVCGPDPFTEAVVAETRAHGVPESQIHDERFSW